MTDSDKRAVVNEYWEEHKDTIAEVKRAYVMHEIIMSYMGEFGVRPSEEIVMKVYEETASVYGFMEVDSRVESAIFEVCGCDDDDDDFEDLGEADFDEEEE